MFDGMHDGWMWGMHWAGWIFWLLVLVGLVWAIARSGRSPSSTDRNETPLEILQRRYAKGEISTEEYEERKERLERDR